jgi:hypothetical protein
MPEAQHEIESDNASLHSKIRRKHLSVKVEHSYFCVDFSIFNYFIGNRAGSRG